METPREGSNIYLRDRYSELDSLAKHNADADRSFTKIDIHNINKFSPEFFWRMWNMD